MDGDVPQKPTVAPGVEFGEAIDLERMLEFAQKTCKSPDKIMSTLEELIEHAANLIPHLPIERHDVPSLVELERFGEAASTKDTAANLSEHRQNYGVREELLLQLISAM